MKSKFIIKFMLILMAVSMVCTSCYERIDAGYGGVKVHLYGDRSGVDDVTLVTGAVWYNPLTTRVHEYST